MNSLGVLFLGAGKRLSLLERFVAAADAEDVSLRMASVERSRTVPIAGIANVQVGPAFTDPGFGPYLVDLAERLDVDVIVPNMDTATVALATVAADLDAVGRWAVVSSAALCGAMEDKRLAAAWFAGHDIPQPATDRFPAIVKARHGFGSRDQALVGDQAELDAFWKSRDRDQYVVQRFVSGPEYTVDAYVARDGKTLGALSRKRLEVTAGEVTVSQTHREPAVLELMSRILAEPGWAGPITGQFIVTPTGPVAIELNPRFGGGVTHSIHVGLDMPRWIIRERFGRPVEPFDGWPDGSLMTRAYRDQFTCL
jgi:carbamoyl-phosphate synthase large subunit